MKYANNTEHWTPNKSQLQHTEYLSFSLLFLFFFSRIPEKREKEKKSSSKEWNAENGYIGKHSEISETRIKTFFMLHRIVITNENVSAITTTAKYKYIKFIYWQSKNYKNNQNYQTQAQKNRIKERKKRQQKEAFYVNNKTDSSFIQPGWIFTWISAKRYI